MSSFIENSRYINKAELLEIEKELRILNTRLRINAVQEKDGKAIAVECTVAVKGNRYVMEALKKKGWEKVWGSRMYGYQTNTFRKYLGEG